MKLDEAIRHAEKQADLLDESAQGCDLTDKVEQEIACKSGKCAEEHRQLAEWLKDYKRLVEYDDVKYHEEHNEVIVSEDVWNDAKKALEAVGNTDATDTNVGKMDGDKKVSIGVLEQVMWERDVAIDQLKELGYGLGQKIEKWADGDRAVSLNAVIEDIKELSEWHDGQFTADRVINHLRQMPSVSRTGHWIEEDMFDGDVAYRCSKCNELFCIIEGTPKDNEYNFCPNCGCRMREDGD